MPFSKVVEPARIRSVWPRPYTTPPGVNADLVMNADGTFTLTYHSSSERLTFTAGGFLTSDADRNGNALVLLYNTDNTLASITDTAGRVTTFKYANGVLSRYIDPAGRSSLYTYDGAGNLTQSTDVSGRAVRYSYDTRWPKASWVCTRPNAPASKGLGPRWTTWSWRR